MLTQQDLVEIETIVDKKLEEKMKYVPSTDLFLSKMDELMGEVKSMREDHAAHLVIHQDINDQLEDHNSKFQTISQKLDIAI